MPNINKPTSTPATLNPRRKRVRKVLGAVILGWRVSRLISWIQDTLDEWGVDTDMFG